MIKNILLALLLSSAFGFAADTAAPAQPTRPPGGGRGFGISVMMDENKDGKVSKEEVLTWFAKNDTNKDGVLDADEIKAMQDKMRANMQANRPGGGPPANRGQGRNAPAPQK